MLEKKQLHELFIITGTVDNVSAIDIKMLKNTNIRIVLIYLRPYLQLLLVYL